MAISYMINMEAEVIDRATRRARPISSLEDLPSALTSSRLLSAPHSLSPYPPLYYHH